MDPQQVAGIPASPSAMYIVAALVLGLFGLVSWIIKHILTRQAEGQDKIVEAVHSLPERIVEAMERRKAG